MKKHLSLFAATLLAVAVNAQSPRMVLYEEFSGENCPPCAATNPGLNALLHQPVNQARVAAIKWEVPIPSAPSKSWSLYQTNKSEIDWRYRSKVNGYGYISQSSPSGNSNAPNGGVNSAPQGRIDGQHQWDFGAASDHPANLNNTALTNAANVPAPFAITMAREWAAGGAAIDLTITVQASQNFTSVGQLVFRTVMVERHILFDSPPGSTNEKEFYDVAIKSFPNIQNGTALASSWTSGQTFTFTLNCPIPSYARKKTEIGFVGFIQDDGDKKVHQAFRLEKEALAYDAAADAVVVPPICSAVFTPTVTIKNYGLNAITNMTITPYINGTAANTTQWTGNLAPAASAVIALDPISQSAAAGVNTFSYHITAINGNDLEAMNNGLETNIYVAATPYAKVEEGFGGTFPPTDWGLLGDKKGKPWVKTSTAGAFGLSPESALMPFYTNDKVGEVQELVLPPADLTGDNDPTLYFAYAYAQRNSQSADKLEVFASDDCGNNWTNVFTRQGSAMISALEQKPNAWVPQSYEWREETIKLTGFNKNDVIVKFVGTNDNGNNLYLDNINLRQTSDVGIGENQSATLRSAVFPNPGNGAVTVSVMTPSADDARITVTNNLGQVVRTVNVSLKAGANKVSLDLSNEAAGIYNAVIKTTDHTSASKFTIIH